MKYQDYIMKFAEGNEDKQHFLEQVRDYYNHYCALKVAGHEKDEYNKEVTFAQKEAIVTEGLKAQIAQLANVSVEAFSANPALYATNPSLSWATFAIVGYVTDLIIPDCIIKSTAPYADVRNIPLGDTAKFDITPRDLFPVTKVSRGERHVELTKQFKGSVTLNPEAHAVSVYVDLFRVLAGLESLAEFMTKVVQSVEAAMALDIYSAFNTAMGNLSDSGDAALKVSGYSAPALISLCQKVTAWNGGKKAVILGTLNALANILPADANYRYDLESEYVKVGYIRNFKGYDVMVLPQVADYRTPFQLMLDDTKIYIVSPASDKLVKVAIGGQAISFTSNTYDFANLIQTGTLIKYWAAGVITSSIAGLITLS